MVLGTAAQSVKDCLMFSNGWESWKDVSQAVARDEETYRQVFVRTYFAALDVTDPLISESKAEAKQCLKY